MTEISFRSSLIDWSPFAERLRRLIQIERKIVEGSYVVALSSKYGSGKSTFLEMWKADLDGKHDDPTVPTVINLNAWESDYYGDPLFAIVLSIVESIEGPPPQALIEAAKDVGWMGVDLAAQLAKNISKVDLPAAKDAALKKRAARNEIVPLPADSFSVFRHRKEAMKTLKVEIEKFIERSSSYVLFLVDELDRCRPDYAIQYLETIKHIFDVKGAVFLLAADRKQLENSARIAFGDLDFEEYLRKFVHREVSLPAPSTADYRKLADSYIKHYLVREGLRSLPEPFSENAIDSIKKCLECLRLSPRQAQSMFRIFGHLICDREVYERREGWSLNMASLAMAAFKVGDPPIFEKFGSGSISPVEAAGYFKTVFGEKNYDWWFAIFAAGNAFDAKSYGSISDMFINVELVDNEEDYNKFYRRSDYFTGWGGLSDGIRNIYSKVKYIESWS